MAPPPLLAAACIGCTVAMFGTGLSDLRQMLATKSVENIQFLPFLTTDVKYSGQPQLVGLRVPEAGLDPDRRQHHRRRAADPLHPGVLLLQPRQACGAAAEPGAAGGAGHGLRLLHTGAGGCADAPGAPGALLQRLHHQHVPVAARRPGQGGAEQVHALPVLPPRRHHLPGLLQLDPLWPPAPRPLHHGPQCARDRHQHREVLALLVVPGQAPQTPPCLRAPDHEGPPPSHPAPVGTSSSAEHQESPPAPEVHSHQHPLSPWSLQVGLGSGVPLGCQEHPPGSHLSHGTVFHGRSCLALPGSPTSLLYPFKCLE